MDMTLVAVLIADEELLEIAADAIRAFSANVTCGSPNTHLDA